MSTRLLRFGTTVCLFWCLGATAMVMAEEKNKEVSSRTKSEVPAETIDLFEGMESGKLEVRFLPKDATQATIVINNKTNKPLDIRLPDAFGGVPVLAQFGGGMGMGGMGGGMGGMGGGGMGGMGGMGGGMGGMGGGMGGGQGMGGGMGGMGGGGMGGMGGMGGGGMGGMGGGGMMGGMMRVEAEKVRKLKVPTVCLEHGKPDPTPRMKYKLVRIEQVNADPRVRELCKLLGYGKIPQNTAQAAAWHLANGLSWQELAAMDRFVSQFGGGEKWFSPYELQNALGLVNIATQSAAKSAKSDSSSGRDFYKGSYTGTAQGDKSNKADKGSDASSAP